MIPASPTAYLFHENSYKEKVPEYLVPPIGWICHLQIFEELICGGAGPRRWQDFSGYHFLYKKNLSLVFYVRPEGDNEMVIAVLDQKILLAPEEKLWKILNLVCLQLLFFKFTQTKCDQKKFIFNIKMHIKFG